MSFSVSNQSVYPLKEKKIYLVTLYFPEIKPAQLEYCEVSHRTLFIHLTSGKVLECIGSLDELSKQLIPYGSFLRPHRSYLANLEYIQELSYRAITMSCLAEIPIPRGKYNEIKNAFLEYAFLNRDVT